MSLTAVPRHALLFNAIVEVSLRTLILLAEISPPARDVEELVIFDYLLVHSADVPGGPTSLHAAVPHRTSELFARRGMIGRSLEMLSVRHLVMRHLSTDGIAFSASELTKPFLDHLGSSQASRAREIAGWLRQRFGSMSRAELQAFRNENIDRWGAEIDLAFPDYEQSVSSS